MSQYRSLVEQRAQKIRDGEELTAEERHWLASLVMLVGQQFYEKSGGMFISGFSGKDESLPKWVFICPSYGCDSQATGLYKYHRKGTWTFFGLKKSLRIKWQKLKMTIGTSNFFFWEKKK